MVLDLQIIMPFPEQLCIAHGCLFCRFILIVEEQPCDLAVHAAGECDQSGMMLFQQVTVGTRFAVKAFDARFGYDLQQILIALHILTEQRQMI